MVEKVSKEIRELKDKKCDNASLYIETYKKYKEIENSNKEVKGFYFENDK